MFNIKILPYLMGTTVLCMTLNASGQKKRRAQSKFQATLMIRQILNLASSTERLEEVGWTLTAQK
ncbi:hypothetical protein [Pedobacter sp. Leaf41]|uniref:hypothetical protein n=1 Tax=Pedobacter sp. Leaf41 TaxID=1736218 RepID=UPI001F1744CA|nr:hypothetical protein [Pedobacter sp. Leaf41]